MQFGTGFNLGTTQNITVDGVKVRSDSAIADGFEQLSGASALFYSNTFSIKNIAWQTWAGINKYLGFQGNPFPFFWARFDGKTGTTCTLKASFNIASCTRSSTGTYVLTFNTPSLDANYTVSGSGAQSGVNIGLIDPSGPSNLTTTGVTVLCVNTSVAQEDCDLVSVEGFGNPF